MTYRVGGRVRGSIDGLNNEAEAQGQRAAVSDYVETSLGNAHVV